MLVLGLNAGGEELPLAERSLVSRGSNRASTPGARVHLAMGKVSVQYSLVGYMKAPSKVQTDPGRLAGVWSVGVQDDEAPLADCLFG